MSSTNHVKTFVTTPICSAWANVPAPLFHGPRWIVYQEPCFAPVQVTRTSSRAELRVAATSCTAPGVAGVVS